MANLFETEKAFINNQAKTNEPTAQVKNEPKQEDKSNNAQPHATKMHEYRKHLRVITNGLIEMAKAAGRTDYRANQLLRECYNLVDEELHSFDEWKELGQKIKQGQHAYLFWGSPIESQTGVKYCPVKFLFAKSQLAV